MDSTRVIGGLIFLASLTEAVKWTYYRDSPSGPYNWSAINELCDGSVQSPIDLVEGDAIKVQWNPFEFKGYDPNGENPGSIIAVKNTGHTAMLELDGFHSVSGGGLPTEYEALQAHFHWGSSDDVGSEHTIGGKQFPLEMHIVHFAHIHFNSSIRDAVMSEDNEALAVLGVLFEIGEEDNQNFEEIIRAVEQVSPDGGRDELRDSVSLLSLLPDDLSTYYRYNGSLTTPDCFQVVAWTVFTDTVSISSSQVSKFRNLTEGVGDDARPIGEAYRPVQPVNGRDVFYNTAISRQVSHLLMMFAVLCGINLAM